MLNDNANVRLNRIPKHSPYCEVDPGAEKISCSINSIRGRNPAGWRSNQFILQGIADQAGIRFHAHFRQDL